jgi:hypothetical protein
MALSPRQAAGKLVFYWQYGYGALSVSARHTEIVSNYITNQKQHHKKITFDDEFRSLLQKYDIKPDEKYPLD